jgi:hypothetical protein
MKSLSLVLSLLFFSFDLLACPYCAGNSQSGKDSNTTLILCLFILAIYIPYYIIYRLIKKNRRPVVVTNDSSGPSAS